MREITYHFTHNQQRYSHTLSLNDQPPTRRDDLPEWTKLEFHRCKGCQWQATDHCPVAVALIEPVQLLNQLYSYEEIDIEVVTPERRYSKRGTVQEGLSGVFGIAMARSHCPAFEEFRGLAWFHLPFASYEETLFRVTSSLLLRHYLREESASHADILMHIHRIYEGINAVNLGIIKRLKEGVAPMCDSPLNAIILLDSMGSLVPIAAEAGLKELKEKFA